jgi:hypothetical protein
MYEGYWKNGYRHGNGKLTTKEFIIEGVWEDGFFVEYAPVE